MIPVVLSGVLFPRSEFRVPRLSVFRVPRVPHFPRVVSCLHPGPH